MDLILVGFNTFTTKDPRNIVGGLDKYTCSSNPCTNRFCSDGTMYTANDEVDTVGFSGKVGVNTANDEDEDLFRWFLEVGLDVVVPLSLLELVGVLL